ncbi:MAG: hypothetical protein ABJ056_00390, partial [Halioglobus sp.]
GRVRKTERRHANVVVVGESSARQVIEVCLSLALCLLLKALSATMPSRLVYGVPIWGGSPAPIYFQALFP